MLIICIFWNSNVTNCHKIRRITVFTWTPLPYICWYGVWGESNDATLCICGMWFRVYLKFTIQETKGCQTISPWQENPRDRLSLTGAQQWNDNGYLVGSQWVLYIMAKQPLTNSLKDIQFYITSSIYRWNTWILFVLKLVFCITHGQCVSCVGFDWITPYKQIKFRTWCMLEL